jgi:hypothetical protein
MPDEHPFTLRQVDLARADFAAIADDLDFIKGQIAASVASIRQSARAYGSATVWACSRCSC